MDNGTLQQLRQRYALENTLLRLERRHPVLTETIKQAKYTCRDREEKLLTYQGSLRSFLDKLSGKREDRVEALTREVYQAKAALTALIREKERLDQEQISVREGLSALPSLDVLREEAARETDTEREWAKLEACYCAEKLIPLLEENHKALLECRSLMQGNHPEILSAEEQQRIHAEPNVWGEQCSPVLARLKAALELLEIPFEIGIYYRAPTAFIVAAAARHNRMDRVNQALDQVLAAQKQVNRLQERFTAE